jgi:hypothetical protein
VTRRSRRPGVQISLALICLLLGWVGWASSNAPRSASPASVGDLDYSYDLIHRPAPSQAGVLATPSSSQPSARGDRAQVGDSGPRADAGVAGEAVPARLARVTEARFAGSPSTGVAAVIEALKGHPLFAHVTLTRSERSPIAALVTEMLEDLPL